MGLISAGVEANVIERPGGIFVRPAHQLPQEDRILLQSVARVIVSDADGTLAEQVARRPPPEAVVPPLQPQPTQYELMAHSGQEDVGDSAGSDPWPRSEEHTSELQSLMRISYAVFCLKKKTHQTPTHIAVHLIDSNHTAL